MTNESSSRNVNRAFNITKIILAEIPLLVCVHVGLYRPSSQKQTLGLTHKPVPQLKLQMAEKESKNHANKILTKHNDI